jgi:hypothetical protein
MKIRNLLFIAIIFAISLMGCCFLPSVQLAEEGEIIVESGFSQVEVRNIAGSIALQEWSNNYTLVKYRKEALSQAALQNVYPSVGVSNGELSVIRKDHNDFINNSSISFDVYLPSDSYHAKISSTSGSVDVKQMEAGDSFDVHTVSGSVDIDGSDSLEITTTSGSVEFVCEVTEEVRVDTTSGSVTGVLQSVDGNADVAVESVSGSVTLTCPAGMGGTFRLRSVSGRVESDYPASTSSGTAGYIALEVTTVSGAIQIAHD